jgi:AcrR family transcriptional regulator
MARKKARPDRGGSRAVGRPRALTIEEILDAAIGLGLTGISLPVLAAKLGIATATLYNYVANRGELLRLAALRQAPHVKLVVASIAR